MSSASPTVAHDRPHQTQLSPVASGGTTRHNRARMPSNVGHLFTTRRFVPLFLVQFFGAFNDNVFKGAFTALATIYFGTVLTYWRSDVSTQLIAAIFILPFFLFSAFAGQLADKYEKSRIVRLTKVWEIGAMALGAFALWQKNPWMLFATLFLMGAQSAFFGPLKYSLLPIHLREEELVGGNAVFEAATYVAIIGGTALGSLSILREGVPHPGLIMGSVLAVAVIGWLASWGVPKAEPSQPDLRINWNIFTATTRLIGEATKQKGVFRAILGISWFWLIGAFWLTLVPAYTKEYLHRGEETYTIFFIAISIGIAIGSLVSSKLSHGEISAKYVPLAGLGVTIFMVDFAWFTAGLGDRFATEAFHLWSATGVRVMVDLAGVAVCGGLFSVPLYAMMQSWAEPESRSRVIAANNVVNALFMTAIAVVAGALFALGISKPAVILAIAAANVLVSLYIITLVPESVVHTVFRWVLRALYQVEVHGEENFAAARERRVIIANHTSLLDAALLTIFLPQRPTFAIATDIAKRWWVRPFLWAVNVHALDPTKPMAIKVLTELARQGVPIAIFPEGRLTVTGAIMKVYEGPGLIADKADADLIPVQISGAMYTPFSHLKGKVRRRWFPRITLTILPPRPFHPPEGFRGRAGRQFMARELYEVLAGMYVATAPTNRTLFQSLLDAAATHGRRLPIIDDLQFKPFTYRRLIAASLYLGPKLCRDTPVGEPVGLLIANSTMAVATFFGVQSMGRVCAMLNYSAGAGNLVSACQTARVRVVWTSRRFVEMARLAPAIAAMSQTGVQIRYLEDLQKRSLADRARLLSAILWPRAIQARRRQTILRPARSRARQQSEADRAAVILFTSGSSGTPKAVLLSHRNLQTNRHQLCARVDFTSRDRFFNCLPVFHAFGLTGGTLLPLLSGAPLFMYPTPLHYGVIPELIYQTNATIIFGTNTFLAGYARRAHPYDFFAVRYVFAGAEKLKDNVRQLWAERFGVRIFEGYGSTECAPALTMNTPMFNQTGTVGRFLPGIAWRLEPVPGVEGGGRLFVRGDNVMLGYFLSDRPGELQPPEDGWYDTGDIVAIDDAGFVKILGRAKRFAKIAGEMVSLTAVEDLAVAVWPKALHAAVTRSHPQKGEEIVLVTEQPEAKRSELLAGARERGLSELAVPRSVISRKKLPVLGSGKPDYVTLEAEVRTEVSPAIV